MSGLGHPSTPTIECAGNALRLNRESVNAITALISTPEPKRKRRSPSPSRTIPSRRARRWGQAKARLRVLDAGAAHRTVPWTAWGSAPRCLYARSGLRTMTAH